MAWTITIGGVDVTDPAHTNKRKIRQGSLNFSTELNARSSGSFSVLSEDGSYTPLSGQEVTAYYDGQRRFGGFVWSVRTRSYRGSVLIEHDVTLVDYNYICDCRRAGERSWKDAKAGQIVRDICNYDLTTESIGYVFVADGPTLNGEWKIGGAPTVTEALNAIAKAADMLWYVDANRELRMFATDTIGYTAAYDVTRANVEELTTFESLEEYANKVILKLARFQRPSDSESYPGDGSARSFGVLFPIASEPIIKVNGSTKTVGVAGVDTGKDWYWSLESNTVTQDDAGTVLTSSDTIEITYVGIDQRNVQATADGTNGTADELSARNALENRSGLHITTVDYSEFANQAKADEVAYQILATLSSLPVVVNYVTNTVLEPNCDLIKPGDKQDILGVEYVVRSVKWQDKPKALDILVADVECVRGPLLKDFAALLKSLTGGDPLPMAAPAAEATTGGGVTPPSQPGGTDWSLPALEYRADANGNQFVHVQGSYSGAVPANADYLIFWLYQGASRPSDPGMWVEIFRLVGPGTNGSWIPQPRAAETWCVCCTASSAEYSGLPDGSTPLKTVDVAAWKNALTITDFSLTATPINGTQLQGRFSAAGTLPTDPNRQAVRIYKRWCLAGYASPSAWAIMAGPQTLPWTQTEPYWDWPADEWTQYEARTLNHAGDETACTPIVSLHMTGGGYLDGSKLNPATLESTLAIKGGSKLGISTNYDLPEVVTGLPSTITGHSRIVLNSADQKLYRWNSNHAAYERLMDGGDVKAELAFNKLTSAEFAAGIEPVGIVSFVPSVKSASTIYNTTDGKTYRWNGSAYVRDMNSTEIKSLLTIDKLVSGQISAGAIGTTELSTAEILIGAGGGKCGRFRINDALGNMIGFHGDDGAGFVGSWASRARFGGTFASPIIDLSSAGASISNAALSLVSGQFGFRVNSTDGMKVSDDFTGCDVQVKSSGLQVTAGSRMATPPVLTATPTLLQMDDPLHSHTAKIGFESIYPIGNAASLNIAYRGTNGISLQSFASYDRLYSPRFNSRIDFSGGGGYINIGEYRVGSAVVIDGNKNYRFPAVFTEDLVLSGLTASKWVPCYDATGAYMGKIPVI